MRYLTPSSRLLRPGLYHFATASQEAASAFLAQGLWSSAVASALLAEQIGQALDLCVPVARDDRKLALFPDDEALVASVNRQGTVRLWFLCRLLPALPPETLLARTMVAHREARCLCVRRIVILYTPGWYWYSESNGPTEEVLRFLDHNPSIHLTADAAACLAEQFLLPEDALISEDGPCRHPLIMNAGDRALICHAQSEEGFHLRFLTRLDDEVAAAALVVAQESLVQELAERSN